MNKSFIYKKQKSLFFGIFVAVSFLLTACQIQFKMNGASIDYTQIKTITLSNFPNRSTLVYPPLEQEFNEALKGIFTRQTRLNFVPNNGDLELEGEITNYVVTPMSIGSDSYSQEDRLTVTVKVRFTNNKDHTQDFETSLSAYSNFDSKKLISEVQDELLVGIIEELTETIYNKTVANW